MEIEFDPEKDAANREKHGLSLAEASLFPLADAVVVPDERETYGELRQRAFGRVDSEPRCLVFTVRGAAVRVISYRRAHEKGMRRHER